MDNETLLRTLRTRPPTDAFYRPRLVVAPPSVAQPAARPAKPRPSRVVLAFVLVVAGLLLAAAAVLIGSQLLKQTPLPMSPAEDGTFSPAGTMTVLRGSGYTATRLSDDRVLIVGGEFPTMNRNTSAEVWDAATDTFSRTGPLGVARAYHTATLLSDGRVLVVGGWETGDSAEIWDPATGTFSPVPSMSATDSRFGSAAVLLNDGRVLIVGGSGGNGEDGSPMTPALVWDPTTDAFATIGTPTTARIGQSATLLRDGRVLIVGGSDVHPNGGGPDGVVDADLFDPATNTFSPTGPLVSARSGHFAGLLPDGRVIVYGNETAGNSAEIWDPRTGTFGPLLSPGPQGTLALLADGRLLVVRSALSSSCEAGETLTNAAEIWDPVSGAISPAGSLSDARTDPVMTRLSDGRVLVVGGQGPQGPSTGSGPACRWYDHSVNSGELWTPTASASASPTE